MVYIKSLEDIKLIKQAAAIWKQTRQLIIEHCRVGVSLKSIDELVNKFVLEQNARCSFYKYRDFPGHICINVNEQLIHGVPTNYIIQKDDLISFDVGIEYQNHHCDAAFTINMNPNNKQNQEILDVTLGALTNAISQIKPGNYIGDIENAIEVYVHQHKYEVIKDFGGHGCGNKIHEDPMIMNFGQPKTGIKLIPNMTLCIEPMVLTNSDQYYIDPKNHWTVIAKNKKLTCHCEHMVLVTNNGCEILTE